MRPSRIHLSTDLAIQEALARMCESRTPECPVHDATGELVGTLSVYEILAYLAEQPLSARSPGLDVPPVHPLGEGTVAWVEEVSVGELMRTPPLTCPADTPLHRVLAELRAQMRSAMLVVDARGACGIIDAEALQTWIETQLSDPGAQ